MKNDFQGNWMGKPIEEYSKEELIRIIWQLDCKWRQDMEQHQKDLEFFSKLKPKNFMYYFKKTLFGRLFFN